MVTSLGPSVLDTSLRIVELKSRKRDAALQELVALAHGRGAVHAPDLLLTTLALRERLGTTAAGKGVAFPNARSIAVCEPRVVVGRSRRGIDWKSSDEAPVQLVFLVLSPGEMSLEAHHEQLARVAGFTRLQRNRARLLDTDDPAVFAGVMREALA